MEAESTEKHHKMEDEEIRRRRGFTSHPRFSPLALLALALHKLKFNRKTYIMQIKSNLEQ